MNPFKSSPSIPSTFDEWKHCITIDCGIPLNASFVQQRITELTNEGDAQTKHFIKLYGRPYHKQIIEWFGRALSEQTKKIQA